MDDDLSESLLQILQIFPFSLLTEEEAVECSQYCEFLECSPRTKIFSTGENADYMFFILAGEVKVTGSRTKAALGNGTCNRGDYFGEEAIMGSTARKTRAESISQTTLLSMKRKHISFLMKTYPKLHDAFILMYQSWKIADELVLPWLVPDEKLQLISRRHKIIPILRLILINAIGLVAFALLLFAAFSSTDFNQLLLVLAFLVLLLGILSSVWGAAEWANDVFIITNLRVIAQRQLYGFFDSRQESPTSAILSTGFDTSLMGRLIGFGTVNLRSYTGEIFFKSLPFPQTIFEYLEHLRGRVTEEKKAEEKKLIQATLTNRLGVAVENYSSNVKPTLSSSSPSMIYQSGSIQDWLARFFQLRQEKGNSIIYRTHWWILLRKTFVPFLLLIVLFFGFIGRLLGMFNSVPEVPFYAATLVLTLISALWWLYQYYDWYNDQYILTRDQLMDVSRKPLGFEDRRSAPVKNIQTVEFKRKGIIGLLLNYGTVRIQIGNEELTFDDVYAPSQIQGEVYLHLKKFQDEQQRQEGQRMAEWITTYDQLKRDRGSEN